MRSVEAIQFLSVQLAENLELPRATEASHPEESGAKACYEAWWAKSLLRSFNQKKDSDVLFVFFDFVCLQFVFSVLWRKFEASKFSKQKQPTKLTGSCLRSLVFVSPAAYEATALFDSSTVVDSRTGQS